MYIYVCIIDILAFLGLPRLSQPRESETEVFWTMSRGWIQRRCHSTTRRSSYNAQNHLDPSASLSTPSRPSQNMQSKFTDQWSVDNTFLNFPFDIRIRVLLLIEVRMDICAILDSLLPERPTDSNSYTRKYLGEDKYLGDDREGGRGNPPTWMASPDFTSERMSEASDLGVWMNGYYYC